MVHNLRSGFYLSSLLAVVTSLAGCIDSRGIVPQANRLNDTELVTDKAIQNAAEEAAWPSQQWWKAYGDPQLDAWIEQAMVDSPSLAQARARVRQAQAMAGIAEAMEEPQINLDVQLQRKRWPDDFFYGPSTLNRNTTWNNLSNLQFSYDLDLWGRLRNNQERALDLARIVATEERAAELELASNIVRTYIQLALHYEELAIVEASLKQREELLHLAERNLRMGLGTHLEVTEAEAPIPNVHRQLDIVHEDIALACNQLAALAGKGPGEGARLKRPKLSLHAEPALPSSLPLELLGRRPDVVASRWQVAAEARGIEVAKAEFYPNVNLLASVGSMAVEGGMLHFLQYANLVTTFGSAISLPVYDGGRRRGNLSATTAGYDIAVEQYNQTLVMALKNISDLLIRMHSLHEQGEFIKHGLETAERRYELAQNAYERGLVDYRRVLEAQTELFKQQRLREQVHASQLSTQAGLWVALGGGVLDAENNPADEKLKARDVTLRNFFD
ncbi:efflux transporter outer membrane subunit [Azomonas macrocytogenes]|uniref:efflux transporter outer membrane subunit n=1 Tax=Azomonas macrocytogenes TaxID=69962 RepID=UPI001605B856